MAYPRINFHPHNVQQAYWNQKWVAKCRGTEFCFTMNDWVAWWIERLGPDWFKLRGRKKDQYCMARLGDKGAYEVGNIKCITNSQNVKERASLKGQKNPAAKLTNAQVKGIINSNMKPTRLAKQYNVSRELIWQIKARRIWRHVAP